MAHNTQMQTLYVVPLPFPIVWQMSCEMARLRIAYFLCFSVSVFCLPHTTRGYTARHQYWFLSIFHQNVWFLSEMVSYGLFIYICHLYTSLQVIFFKSYHVKLVIRQTKNPEILAVYKLGYYHTSECNTPVDTF